MPSLTATYASPSTPSLPPFTQTLPDTPAKPSTAERIDFLGGLQTSVKALQNDINVFLTQKMEEDKATAGGKIDDKLEENYGEEVAEEE